MADLFITLSVIVKLAVCFFLTLFFGFVFYVYSVHSKYSHIPGPPRSNFFFGNLLQIRKRRTEQGKNIHQSLAEWATEYRPILVIWFFHIPLAVVSDADLVRQVLVVKDLPKDPFGYRRFQYVFGQRFLGRGLLTDLDRLTWETKKRALTPAFHRNKLLNLLPTINSRVERFLQGLEDLADGKTEVAMADKFSAVTLDSVLKVKNFLVDLYPLMSAGQDGFDARFNVAIVKPEALTRKESATFEISLRRTKLQDLNQLYNTIYCDHNGDDIKIEYCLDEEALAEFDNFDEQVCLQLNSNWQSGNLVTRATKERRHVLRWTVILYVLYQYTRRTLFEAYGPISRKIPKRYVKQAIKLNEYFAKQKDIIQKIVFSLDMNETEFHQFRTHFRDGLNGIILSFRSPAMKYLPWSSVRKQCIDGARASRDIMTRIVEDRQKDIDSGRATPDDMLSYIFKFKDTLPGCNIDDLVDMAVTFVFGGMETMSNHMAFTLLSIFLHPDVEKRLREELDEVIDGRNLVTAEDIQSLPYLDKVMKEALRLHPPTTAITRATDKDIELGGLLIPANTPLMVNPFVLHHHPDYWDNPESFQPDRFDSEDKLHQYAYFPFSLGSRRCVGVQLSQIEVKLVIARLLQRFSINLLPGQSLEVAENVTFCPADGVRCTLKLRKS